MIVIRNDDEIDLIRKAGKIVRSALDEVESSALPGVSTAELDDIARKEIIRRDGYPAFKGYKGYPANICVSVNEVVVHGIPSDRKIRSGDIVSVDIGVRFRDYYADAARTFGVGRVSSEAEKLMSVTSDSLRAGIDKAAAGNRLSDVSATIQAVVELAGFSVVRSFVGHGIGRRIHEEPEIPNFGKPGSGPRLEEGMILAIEPMVNAGAYEVEVLEDGWTAVTKDRKISAHFEHTIAVRKDKAEILAA